jgi:peroxisomal 3,2-trans-enoyl-CoA isomerase
MMRSVVEHKKVLILALNGPGVGGGAAWFQGVADLVFAAEGSWLQVPFNALGLVPENGSVVTFAQSIGVHRANEFLMFGKKMSVEELQKWGLVNTIFPAKDFHKHVVEYLQEQLDINDGRSMILTKQLANAPLRDQRMVAIYNAFDALAERAVDGASVKRFAARRKELEGRSIVFVNSIRLINGQQNQRRDRSCE